ncbi:MAG: LamB/YcsF family protein [Vibrio sp.]
MAQVRQLVEQGSVQTLDGETLPLNVDTICVHGDNDESVATISRLKDVVHP